MNPDLCIYEDANAANLSPLSLTRSAYELRCGMFSLVEKLVRHFPGHRVRYFVRKHLVSLVAESHDSAQINTVPDEASYFINGRFVLHDFPEATFAESTAFVCNGQVVGAYLARADLGKLRCNDDGTVDADSFDGLPKAELAGFLIEYPWDLVQANASEIVEDFKFMQHGGQIMGKLYPNVTLLAQENIYLGAGAKLHPGVVIDGESGPVYISEGCEVMSNAVIEGPAYIGRNSRIKIGAKIYEGTSIGDVCKVGGEVEESIIHAYSNKQHEGFLGHAYLAEWVNLGADTNNSDLKNNYGSVKLYINGQMIDSGSMFVGLFVGDHSKSGINTMFNTGTVVGVMSNVFGAGYTPKYIPSFTWGGIETFERYEFEKAIETAKTVMGRRKKEVSSAQIEILRKIYDEEMKTKR